MVAANDTVLIGRNEVMFIYGNLASLLVEYDYTTTDHYSSYDE